MMRLVIAGVVFWSLILVSTTVHPQQHSGHQPDCDIDRGACTKNVKGIDVLLKITPQPVRAMEELTFTVTIHGDAAYEKLFLDLGMPGMYMGENRVTLMKSSGGRYSGKGTIIRCPSGRRLWRATIDIPSLGKAAYTFNVAY